MQNKVDMAQSRTSVLGNSEKYALWLKPGNEVYYILRRIIVSLSEEFRAPLFEPHITVAGEIMKPEIDIRNMMDKVTEKRGAMTLYLTETGFQDSVYQSLYVHIATNEALLALRDRCLTELKINHKPYMPHVSLIYKKLATEQKQRIIERVGKHFDLFFIPDKLYLMKTTGRPENWKEVMHTSLLP